MKKWSWLFFCLIPLFSIAQQGSTEPMSASWREVERLIGLKNYAQTIPLLADIKANARKTHNRAEWIRAVLAESRALGINSTADRTFVLVKNHFEHHIGEADVLERSVLQSFYALFLHANIHRYRSNDPDVFVMQDEVGKIKIIDSLFTQSLAPVGALAREPVHRWRDLFVRQHNRSFTPTLFHFLAHQYLGFLQFTEARHPETAEGKTTSLMQELTRLNETGRFVDAAAYLMSYRLPVNSSDIRAELPKFLEVIDRQKSNYNAFLLHRIAKAYDDGNDPQEAMKYVSIALEDYPNSPWIDNIKDLSNAIRKAEIAVTHPVFAPADQYTPVTVSLRNMDTLYVRVYNTTGHPRNKKVYEVTYDSLTHETRLDAPLVYEEKKVFRSFDDHRAHRTIYKIDPLGYGTYTILWANNPAFKDDGLGLEVARSKLTATDVFVSAVLEEEADRQDVYKVLLINRKTGVPLRNQKVRLYETDPPAAPELIRSYRTDRKGQFTYRPDELDYGYDLDAYMLFLPGENQFIDLMELANIPRHAQRESPRAGAGVTVQTMTDRAIYRPGQPVYFKNILYNNHALLGKVLDKQEISVFLYDANNQQIDSLTLETNGYGSVNGVFQLPGNTLAGSFSLVVFQSGRRLSTHRVRVEEYKRPTFSASFNINQETYTLNDTAVFRGLAETLSGVPLAHASVRYKVNFYHAPQRKNIVFADSVIAADEQGKFNITVPLTDSAFAGLTDFTLQYVGEVHNQTGEMQSASGHYRFSAKPWHMIIQSDRPVEERRWTHLHIHTHNQNRQPLAFAGTVHIYKYIEPDAVLTRDQEQYFRNVDYHQLSGDEYKTYFPDYFDESLLQKEAQKTLVRSYDFDTRDTSLVQIDSGLFAQGRYWVEAISIQVGDTIRSSATVDLYEAKSGKVSHNEFLGYQLDKHRYGIGDTVSLTFRTDIPHAKKLILFESHGIEKGEIKILDWKRGKAVHRFVLQKEHVSPNLRFSALLVVDNKASTVAVSIPIHREDKELSIRTTTFRDKITPGEKEKWRFTVSHRDRAMEAEVLATMYDAALDRFAGNRFLPSLPLHYPYSIGVGFHHMLREFRQMRGSRNIFTEHQWFRTRDNALPQARSYGLWAGYRSYGLGGVAVLEEVALAADGPQAGKAGVRTVGTGEEVYFEAVELPPVWAPSANLKDTLGNEAREELLDAAQTRTNLQETAFFYPELYTDADGTISFEFDSPEALTRWKLLLFAHGKNLEAGAASFFTQTQKQLMVRPNLPRYFREGDRISVKAQVQNLSSDRLAGNARIEIIDPENNENISSLFLDGNSTTAFEVNAENNSIVEWSLQIPAGHPIVQIRIVAATDEFSDGELHEVPVLPNKVLVSDTEKIILKPQETSDYQLLGAGKENLHAKVQVQTNPILEILSALDYLKNYPQECSEQTASKWFALNMALYIQKNYPAIADYFKTVNKEEAKGRLEENSSLNELTMEEMPWLRDIKGEKEKRKAIAQLFGSNIQADISALERKLSRSQLPDGSFAWFEGGKPNTNISIRILEIAGKVRHLDHTLVSNTMHQSVKKLAGALDKDSTLFDPKNNTLQVLNYLYARHRWNDLFPLDGDALQKLNSQLLKLPEVTARNAAGVAAKAWVVNQLLGEAKQSEEIKNRITQEAIYDVDRGMYWESNQRRYDAISLHSYLVEAYKLHDSSRLHEITQWIYCHKQANHWRSTWATVDAIYALLLVNNPQDFTLENTIRLWVDEKEVTTAEVVLGQSTKDFSKAELEADRNLSLQNNNNRTVYGSIVHQYLAPLEEIQSSTHAISVQKQYYVERQGKWVEANEARLGERIKVKVTVINDSPLEYVHLKDARPSGVEPMYQPSGYSWWQGYYFTMKDASTNYFFDYLPKGKREFEYEVKANNTGVFNSGITTVACMYDPAVNARSNNVVLRIVE